MIIQVTQEDIQLGIPRCDTDCPIAVAIRRITSLPGIEVDDGCIEVDKKQYLTPEIAEKFIETFDAGYPVKPFEFELVEIDHED